MLIKHSLTLLLLKNCLPLQEKMSSSNETKKEQTRSSICVTKNGENEL